MTRSEVVIYEPLWRPGQTLQEVAFEPLRLANNRFADWRELRIFVDFFRQQKHLLATKTGIFSPKFRLKSGITGDRLLAFARQNERADVCIINVFPTIPYCSYNVWMQGEAAHPGLMQRAQALLDAVGLDWRLEDVPRHNRSKLCMGNFWVGTAAFWESFVGRVLEPIACFLEEHPRAPQALAALERADYLVDAPFLPFIAERLFSTFLSFNDDIRVAAFDDPQADLLQSCSSEFRREVVRQMRVAVDEADASGYFSPELKAQQALLTRLSAMHHRLYFQVHPHPHLSPLDKE